MKIFYSKVFSKKQLEKGVQCAFLVFSTRDIEHRDVCIEEFSTHYELLVREKNALAYRTIEKGDLLVKPTFHSYEKGKIDKFDLATILYTFIESPYFKEEKPVIFYQTHLLKFTKKEEFPSLLKKIQLLF